MEVLESSGVSDAASVSSCGGGGGSEQDIVSVKGSESCLGHDILDDFDSYMEDINDRLIISRMVSDSIVKGMVNAVEQEAADKISGVELEVAELREKLGCCHFDGDESEVLGDSQFCCNESVKWREMINEVLRLRQDIVSISKLMTMPETEQLVSHRSFESFGERKLHTTISSPIPSSALLTAVNGNQESKITLPLEHMGKPQLIEHFKMVTTKMKRDHESDVHKVTEELFSLKREYLKEKGHHPLSPFLRCDKEFDVLKKKISEVNMKLGDIIFKNEKLHASSNHAQDMTSLKNRFNALLSKNRELRNLIANNTHEAKHTVLQDEDIRSIIMEGLFEIIYKATLKDADEQVSKLFAENNFLRRKLKDSDKASAFEVEENERLQLEILRLNAEIVEKEKRNTEITTEFAKENKRLEFALEEIYGLKDLSNLQETLISERNAQLDSVNCELIVAKKQIDFYNVETSKLNQKHVSTMNELVATREERNTLLIFKEGMQNNIIEAREKELRKQMESITGFGHGLTKALQEFECRVAEDIRSKTSRIQTFNSHCLKLKRAGLRYKQKLEKRSSDLRLAEAEVDLLGDQVDALFSLLEKVYIGLDHYSPILRHYPGIIEILNLVRRELSG